MFDWIKEILSQCWDHIKFWAVINHYEEGVLLRFGNYKKVLLPGLHFKIPIADYVFSSIVKIDTMPITPVNICTIDNKTITIGAMVKYDIVDIKKYLIDTNEAKGNMQDLSRGIISDYLEDCTWDDIRLKKTIKKITNLISKEAEEMGIRVLEVKFTDKCITRTFKIFGETHDTLKL